MRTLWIFIILLVAQMAWAVETVQVEKPDPTKNVMSLVYEAVKRLDDINAIQKKAIDDRIIQQHTSINEKLDMFMLTSKELAAAEKSRVDAIRAFDTNAAQIDRERAATQARVLAEQVQNSNDNMRQLVANVQDSTTKQVNQITLELGKRIAELERAQSILAGSQTGIKELWPLIFGAVMLLIAIAAFIVPKLKAEPNGRAKPD